MVGLAERLRGSPFHLVATHTHDNVTKNEVLAFLRANGVGPHAPNFTVTKLGGHPKVKGNGILVPYSAVFDHRGKLVYEHMSGSYHGGDGWTMIEHVDAKLAEVPAIYVGAQPYEHASTLAKKIAMGRLAGTVAKIEKGRQTPEAEARAELDRLHAAVKRHRDRAMADALALEGTRPSELVASLRKLSKALKGTTLVADVDAKLAAMEGSPGLAKALEIEKGFWKTARSWNKLKEKKRTEAAAARTVKKLEKLIAGSEDLPISETVEAFLADLR